jgi:predicted HicB family RNase H-like nuclease
VISLKAISVRVPQSLHAELLEEAKREGVSLNQLCLTKLARPLEWYRQKEIEKKRLAPDPEV